MSFEDLKAFLLVAEEGSFLSAADRLGVSRTTLRRQVDALEAQAGVPLLDRGAKGAVLTDAGKRLLDRGRAMEQEFAALLRSARESAQRPEGEVRILVQIGLPPSAFGAIWAMFRASWPGIRMRTRFCEEPLEGDLSDVDVLVWFGRSDPGPAWETHTVLPVRHHLFASRAYLDERGTPKTVEDLAQHDLLAWLPVGDRDARLLTRNGTLVPIKPVLASTNVDLIHETARNGHGIAWAPDGGIPDPPGHEPLVPVLDDLIGYDSELRLAVPRALAEVPKIRVFFEAVQATREYLATAKQG